MKKMKIGYRINDEYEIASDSFVTSAEAYEALDKRKWDLIYEIGFKKCVRYIAAKRM